MVNVFIVNSSSDGADADKVKDYLEQADSAGIKHANVLILKHHVSSWHREFRRLMQETQLILFLQGEDSAKSVNIKWEMELAFELNKAVLVHQLRSNLPLPDWMKEQDAFTGESVDKATICSLEDVKKCIERYDRKEYDIFSKSYLNLSPTDAEKEKERLFEQYKLYQATSEAVVERRQTVSNLYIIINGAFLTVIGTVIAADSSALDMSTKLVVSAIMSVAGIILNNAWKQIIKSYGLLNQRKIEALNLIEENLPLRLYAVEWEIMDDKMNLKKYKSFTSTEVRTPELFSALYLVILLFFMWYTSFQVFGRTYLPQKAHYSGKNESGSDFLPLWEATPKPSKIQPQFYSLERLQIPIYLTEFLNFSLETFPQKLETGDVV